MADRVLVTGVSGFLGGHVALALLDRGYRVRGSVRHLDRADKVRATLRAASAAGAVDRLEFVALDLDSDAGWREASEDCRYLQHVASPLAMRMPRDKNDLIRPAVEGTRRALEAALEAGVERIVLTSSFAAIGYGHGRGPAAPFSEADWSKTEGPDVTFYTESKTRAELTAWSIMEAAGRRDDLAVVNPTGILGPLLDDDPGTSGALVKRLLDGSVPAVPRISFGIVDVRDVAEMQVMAMENPAAGGKRFIATAGPMSLKTGAEALRTAFPDRAGKIPRRQLPDWLVRLIGLVNSEIGASTGSLGVVKQIDNSAGRALLGHPFIAPGEAAIAMARSLIEQKLV